MIFKEEITIVHIPNYEECDHLEEIKTEQLLR